MRERSKANFSRGYSSDIISDVTKKIPRLGLSVNTRASSVCRSLKNSGILIHFGCSLCAIAAAAAAVSPNDSPHPSITALPSGGILFPIRGHMFQKSKRKASQKNPWHVDYLRDFLLFRKKKTSLVRPPFLDSTNPHYVRGLRFDVCGKDAFDCGDWRIFATRSGVGGARQVSKNAGCWKPPFTYI